MTPAIVAAQEAIATALALLDGEKWGPDGARLPPGDAPDCCVTLVEISEVGRALRSPWFDGLHRDLTRVREQLIEARKQLETMG